MPLEDGGDSDLPFYASHTSLGSDGDGSEDIDGTSNISRDYPYYEQDLWGNSTSSQGGVEFGVAIINPNLGGGNGSNLIPYGLGPDPNYATDHLHEERNWVVVGILVALIVMLWVILGGMLCYPLIRFVKRKWPVSQRRINRRYDTIEGWLITKVVRPHDDNCQEIQKNFVAKKSTATNVKETTITITTSTSTITSTTTGTKTAASSSSTAREDDDNHHDDEDNSNVVYDEENPSPGTEIIQHLESCDTMETAIMTIDGGDDNIDNHDDKDDDQQSNCSSRSFSTSGAGGCGEGNHQECPICMERFQVGDIVSWSSYERCSHVYHHQCIKAWLLSHNTCPFCREVFLPVDKANVKKISNDLYMELSAVRTKRSEKTYFCVRNGLVTLDDHHFRRSSSRKSNTTSCSSSGSIDKRSTSASTSNKSNSKKTALSSSSSSSSCGRSSKSCGHRQNTTTTRQSIREKLRPGVTKADLKRLRGDRVEKICYGDAGGNLTIIENHSSSEEFDDENNQTQQIHDSTTHIMASENSFSDLLEQPTIITSGRNDSLTADTSDEDDDGEQDEEKGGQEAGLDGLIEDTSTRSSISFRDSVAPPSATQAGAAETALPVGTVSGKETPQEQILVPPEIPLPKEDHSATTAIEVELSVSI